MCTWDSFACSMAICKHVIAIMKLKAERCELLGSCAACCILVGLETFAWPFSDLVLDVLQLEFVLSFTCIQPLMSSPTKITVVKADFCCSVGL